MYFSTISVQIIFSISFPLSLFDFLFYFVSILQIILVSFKTKILNIDFYFS